MFTTKSPIVASFDSFMFHGGSEPKKTEGIDIHRDTEQHIPTILLLAQSLLPKATFFRRCKPMWLSSWDLSDILVSCSKQHLCGALPYELAMDIRKVMAAVLTLTMTSMDP